MLLYVYNRDTKEFIGEVEANLDPLESALQNREIFVIPPYCTRIPPVETKENEVNVYNEELKTWELKQDNRGLIVYNKETKEPFEIEELGEIPDGFSLEPVFDLQEYKATVVSTLDVFYGKAQASKIKIGKILVSLDDRTSLLGSYKQLDEEHREFYFDTDAESVLLNKEETKDILEKLYARSMELPEKRNYFLKKIRGAKSKKTLDTIIKEIEEFK